MYCGNVKIRTSGKSYLCCYVGIVFQDLAAAQLEHQRLTEAATAAGMGPKTTVFFKKYFFGRFYACIRFPEFLLLYTESHCGELRRLALDADEALRTLRHSSEQYTQHSQQQLAQQHQQIAALELRVQELNRQVR